MYNNKSINLYDELSSEEFDLSLNYSNNQLKSLPVLCNNLQILNYSNNFIISN